MTAPAPSNGAILSALLDPPGDAPHTLTGFEGGRPRLARLLALAAQIKANPQAAYAQRPLAGKILTGLFLNPSLRTRTSFEAAMLRLGGHFIHLAPGSGAWNMEFSKGAVMDGTKAEHIQEAAGVLSSYSDAIGLRAFAPMQDFASEMTDLPLNALAQHASVPVVSFESACYHPCQALADALTLTENFGGDLSAVQGKRFTLAWTRHPKNCGVAVPHSTLLTAARLGMHVTLAHPEGYDLHPEVVQAASQLATTRGGSLTQTDQLGDACADTDVIYAKAWGSPLDYGDPVAGSARNARYPGWTIGADHMQSAAPDARFMHCLPVRRNVVVTDAVLDSSQSVVQQQAANRMYAQMALLVHTLAPGSLSA